MAMRRELMVMNKAGLHARPVAKLVRLTRKFISEITFENDGDIVDAKSIISVNNLALRCQDKVMVTVNGIDEIEAMEAITQLFADKFGELE